MASAVRMTKHQLWEYGELADHFAKQGRDWPFMIAYPVLEHFLGREWCKRHLFNGGHMCPPPIETDRLRYDEIGMLGQSLAELLFNLQDVEGFEMVRRKLAKGEIEACRGELEVGRFLRCHEKKFRFLVPTGRRTYDYDIEVSEATGRPLCCEVKTKVDASTEITVQSVLNSLKDAKRQLPKNKPGVV